MTQAPNDKAARLIDVARRAEVSRATAARALGGYGLVTEATRERVMAAAAELNYRVNELARSMRSGRSLTIERIAPKWPGPKRQTWRSAS